MSFGIFCWEMALFVVVVVVVGRRRDDSVSGSVVVSPIWYGLGLGLGFDERIICE